MKTTPQSNRLHVTFFGETNSGKSALFNAVLGADASIVSDISGTTTDAVSRSMELLPFGPIVLTDTAGLNDAGILGKERMSRTKRVIERTDYAVYIIDIESYNKDEFVKIKREFDKRHTPCMVVFSKADLYGKDRLAALAKEYDNSFVLSAGDRRDIEAFKAALADRLSALGTEEPPLIEGLLEPGGVALLVTPIDSEAPKGRLILPQVQLIRDCLDNGIRCNVTTVKYLRQALTETERIDLVVTDSQAFKEVADIVPQSVMLTSFSILMARQKGNIELLLEGVKGIEKLKDGDRVLIAEACVHSRGHEDIGQVKIPGMLRTLTGKDLSFDFSSGRDWPENMADYALVVHCGGCMLNRKEMTNRLNRAREGCTSITNYGVALAYAAGILNRSVEILGSRNLC